MIIKTENLKRLFQVGSETVEALKERGQELINLNQVKLKPYGDIAILSLSSPDGAIIEFYEQ